MSNPIKKVTFVSSSCGATRRYRVYHQAEQLRMRGIITQVLEASKGSLRSHYGSADVVIAHRLACPPLLKNIIQEAHRHGSAVLLDVDDLIFEPSLAPMVGGYQLADSAAKRREFMLYLENERASLKMCDGVIATTERLAFHCRQLNSKVMVNRNALCSTTIRNSQALPQRPSTRTEGCTLGYFSGTPTHDADFSAITGALNRVMQADPQVSLLVAGHLSLPEDLRFRDRIKHCRPVPWEELPALIQSVDISLAPLDRANPFCHCKSEVKYIEAGICHVPTVASDTDGFREAIRDGETGFLAKGEEEWVAKISALAASREMRREIGERAFRHVVEEYSPEKRAGQFIEAMAGLVREIQQERMSTRGSISVHPGLQRPARGPGMPGGRY